MSFFGTEWLQDRAGQKPLSTVKCESLGNTRSILDGEPADKRTARSEYRSVTESMLAEAIPKVHGLLDCGKLPIKSGRQLITII